MYNKIEILAERIVDAIDKYHEKYHFVISIGFYLYLGAIMMLMLYFKNYILSILFVIIPVSIYFIARRYEKRKYK